MQMMCTETTQTHLIIWSPIGCLLFKIERDEVLSKELAEFIRLLHNGIPWIHDTLLDAYRPTNYMRVLAGSIRQCCNSVAKSLQPPVHFKSWLSSEITTNHSNQWDSTENHRIVCDRDHPSDDH